jgi:hypothetical protein
MVTVVVAVTAMVVTVKLAVVAPVATTTLAGVVEDALLSDSVTVLCAAVPNAGAFKVTVPVEEVPPFTLAGFMDIDARITGLMLSPVVCVDPL